MVYVAEVCFESPKLSPFEKWEIAMSIEGLIIWLIVGGVAGWLASLIMKSGALRLTGHHLVDTVITGIIGAFVGGWLLGAFGVSVGSGIVGSIVSAFIGAVVFIFGLGLIKR